MRKDDFVQIKTSACMSSSLHLCYYMALVYFDNDDEMPLVVGCCVYEGVRLVYSTQAVRFELSVNSHSDS
jgi:hypothetical protein